MANFIQDIQLGATASVQSDACRTLNDHLLPSEDPFLQEDRERAHELAKYFAASAIVPGVIDDHPLDAPRSAPDNTLTALAQLGAFRLNCNRSFISLIDRSHQYIIGEATRSTSLLFNDLHKPVQKSEDTIYLGFRSLDLSFGVCPLSMQIFTSGRNHLDTPNITANRSRYVIRDFCADPLFSSRPYVAGWPNLRSYAEVPLTSAKGFVIGTYCVIDNKPRTFGDDEIGILNEVASTIMNHLELVKTKAEFDRVEGLVRGIGSYVAGYSDLYEHQTRTSLEKVVTGGFSTSRESPVAERPSLSGLHSASAESLHSLSSDTRSNINRVLESSRRRSDLGSLEEYFARRGSVASVDTQPDADRQSRKNPHLASDIGTAYSRAAHLIRQSMEVQGVVFVSAAPESARTTRRSFSNAEKHNLPMSDSRLTGSRCSILGQSTEAGQRLDNASVSESLNLSEAVLQRLLFRYPFGHVFSFDELGVIPPAQLSISYQARMHPSRREYSNSQMPDSISESEDAAELFKAAEHAHSIVFLPIWDFQKDRWIAATIGWSSNPTRILDVGDLNYMSAFGNSITAEVNRLEASALSRAKSDFISSVSHELRSPLHGILAGSELLRQSASSTSESSMLDTIDSCGNMLLDTIDHLLDFAKIKHLTSRSKTKSLGRSAQSSADTSNRLTIVDLGELVQDVVEGVYLGFSSRGSKPEAATGDRPAATPRSLDEAVETNSRRHNLEATVVLVDIEPAVDFTFETEIGAWKRIVMNLFGNALKYTARGRIEVDLRLVEQLEDAGPRTYVQIQVNDTGRGIGKDYLQHRLFTPFAQENELSVGTGLGLSIVQQLVSSLEGSIDVESEVGVGTRIIVMIPVGDKARRVPADGQAKESLRKFPLNPSGPFKGSTLYVSQPENERDALSASSSQAPPSGDRICTARELLTEVAERSLGMNIISGMPSEITANSKGIDRFILEQDTMTETKWTLRVPGCNDKIASTNMNGTSHESDLAKLTIHHPIGPRKLAMALVQAVAAAGEARSAVAAATDEGAQLRRPDSAIQDMTSLRPDTPRVAIRRKSLRQPSTSPIPSHGPGSRKHLLLVDDNAVNLKVLSKCVERIGCTYTCAMDGLEAVEAYKEDGEEFDLIFMDLSMPVMDGCTATREIRAYEVQSGVKRTPVIALTALGADSAQQEAFMSGADLFISKPVKMSEINAIVRNNTDLDRE